MYQKTVIIALAFLLGLSGKAQMDFSAYHWQVFNSENSIIPHDMVSAVFQDRQDRLWFTTNGQGFINYDGKDWKKFPFPFERIGWLKSIVEDDDGKFYIAGNPNRLLTYDTKTGRWDSIAMPGEQPWQLVRNKQGTIIVGCTGPGSKQNLFQLRNGHLSEMGDSYQDIFSLYVAPNGDLLAAFRDGLYRYRVDGDGMYELKPRKMSNLAFYQVAYDSKGTLWGTAFNTTHLHSLKNGKWTEHVDGPEDLYYDFNGRWKYCAHRMVVLPDDRVMISTQFGAGIGIFDGQKWESYKVPTDGEFDGIGALHLDQGGNVWCGTQRHGLALFRAPDNMKFTSSPKRKWENNVGTNYKFLSDGKEQEFFKGEKRSLTTKKSLDIDESMLMVEIRDNKKIDQDIVSVFFNGELVAEKVQLSHNPIQLHLMLEDGNNELVLFAHNLGSIPPNTAAIKLTYGEVTEELELASDLEASERIIIWNSP